MNIIYDMSKQNEAQEDLESLNTTSATVPYLQNLNEDHMLSKLVRKYIEPGTFHFTLYIKYQIHNDPLKEDFF